MALEFLLSSVRDSCHSTNEQSSAVLNARGSPFSGIVFSVERNTIQLEGGQHGGEESVQEKVSKETGQAKEFLGQGYEISITCYVGGNKCTKQAEMLDSLGHKLPSSAAQISPHLTCNFAPHDTAAYISKLHETGVQRVLALSGDRLRFKPFQRDPDLRESSQLVGLIRAVEKDRCLSPFTVDVAYSPYKSSATEQRRLIKKIEAGADSVKTQPVTYADAVHIERDLDFLRRHLPNGCIGFSVILFQSYSMAAGMKKRFGVDVPSSILYRLQQAGAYCTNETSARKAVVEEGITIASQSVAYLISRGVQHINVMGVKKIDTFNKIIERAGEFLSRKEGYA